MPRIGSGVLNIAVITCSDTRTPETDTAGAALEARIALAGWVCRKRIIVPDDRDLIAKTIASADEPDIDIILTCGGTGLGPRDVTPEATRLVCTREVPGIAEAIRNTALAVTNRAMLSRAICMQRITPDCGTTLVINFPGSQKAARESWDAIVEVLPHAIEMTLGNDHS